MSKDSQRRVDEVRARSSDLENHLVDELRAGRLSRREFVRNGTVVGMSMTTIGLLASACGGQQSSTSSGNQGGTSAQSAKVDPGGTIRAGIVAPASDLDPFKVNNEGALAVLGQTGEYLARSNSKLELEPRLAESWQPNRDASAWTFQIRQGVTFHNGEPLTAEDVAATINAHADPDNGSNALSAIAGVVSKGAAKAVDDSRVEVQLDAPNGNFPYLVSSDDNYNLIILPKGYDFSKWKDDFLGTGPWKLEQYTPDIGVTYVRNRDYWDKSHMANPDKIELKFYGKEQARILGLQGGEVDLMSNFSVTGGKALLNDANLTTMESRASVHRQIHMRTDKGALADKRVRQAVALLLNRRNLVDGLFDEKADFGNDSPFAPVFPDTDKSVPQRQQDVERAKALLQDAGVGSLDLTLTTWDGFEIPQLAQLIQNDLKAGGVDVKLNITDAGTYYGDAVFGKSPWLDSEFGITDYGHRGVPNVFLTAPLKSGGAWNAAHFKNKTYDKVTDDYVAALEPGQKKQLAKQIQELLLDESPMIVPYFYFLLTAARKNVAGVEVSAQGHVDLQGAGFTA